MTTLTHVELYAAAQALDEKHMRLIGELAKAEYLAAEPGGSNAANRAANLRTLIAETRDAAIAVRAAANAAARAEL